MCGLDDDNFIFSLSVSRPPHVADSTFHYSDGLCHLVDSPSSSSGARATACERSDDIIIESISFCKFVNLPLITHNYETEERCVCGLSVAR